MGFKEIPAEVYIAKVLYNLVGDIAARLASNHIVVHQIVGVAQAYAEPEVALGIDGQVADEPYMDTAREVVLYYIRGFACQIVVG